MVRFAPNKHSPRTQKPHLNTVKRSHPSKHSPLKRPQFQHRGPPTQDRPLYPQARTKLYPIPEEADDDHGLRNQAVDTLESGEHQEDDNQDIDTFEWDETTLVEALLSDDSPFDLEQQEINAKANALQAPMSALSKETKVNIVKTLVPAVRRLQEAHKVLDLEIDPAFGDGLLGFDDSCQAFERAIRKERTEFVPMYEDISRKRADTIKRLTDAYARLAKLCTDFEAEIDDIANPAIEDLKAFPEDFEKTVVEWEKKAKDIDKDLGESARTKEQLLRQFLDRV